MRLLQTSLLCGVLAAVAPAVWAQAYPGKPVRMIAASSPGSAVDIVARIVAQKLSEQMGQQVIIDNRAGAGGNLGAELAAKAVPDGYTLFMGTPAHAINTGLYRKLNYDLVRDFAPVSQVTSGAYVIVVHPSLPVKSVKELITLARSKPGQLNYASAGSGNATHLAGELFNRLAKVRLVHVPYKGSGPAMLDLISGRVSLMFENMPGAVPHIKAGKVRALAQTGLKRTGALPEVRTIAESGVPAYESLSWSGIAVASGTPREVIARLNREINAILATPEMRQKLSEQGADVVGGTPEAFAEHIKREREKWSRVVRDANIVAN